MALFAKDWYLDERTSLMLPRQMLPAGDVEGELEQHSVIAYFSTAEALRWRPWPDSIAGDAAGMQPHDEETAKRSDAAQLEAHRTAAGGAAVDGYASWLSVGAAQKRADPLLVREASQHTGTCIWAASWLHRRWALARAELFPAGAHILEMGAGCGLLGLSVAAAHGVHVTLSDFRGHFVGGGGDDTVLHNLAYNAWRNEQLIRANGGAVTTIELDWQRPNEPVRWQVVEAVRRRERDEAETTASGEAAGAAQLSIRVAEERSSVRAADVVLATEVLYTEEGMRLFVGCLALWLARPTGATPAGGTCYLVNNAHRTGVQRFEATCRQHGLAIEQLPSLEGIGLDGGDSEIRSTFAPPWDEIDLYTFMKVTWAPPSACQHQPSRD